MNIKSKRSCLVMCLALLGAAVAAIPQLVLPRPAAARSESPYVHVLRLDESAFPKIKVAVSITDERGQPVGVGVAHLMVAENGVALQPEAITGQNEPGPLTTLLMLDTSPSMYEGGKLKAAQSAARALVEQMRAGDRAAVVAFNNALVYAQPATGDYDALARAIAGLTSWQDTAFFAAPQRELRQFDSVLGRKAIIVLTDGVDQHSRSTLNEFLGALAPGQLLIAAVGLVGAPPAYASSAQLDESALLQLAHQTGGNYANAADTSALLDLYQQLAHPLPSDYLLTYTSPSAQANGLKRTVSVSLAEQGTAGVADYTPGARAASQPSMAASMIKADLMGIALPTLPGIGPGWQRTGGALLGLATLLAMTLPLQRTLAGARPGRTSAGFRRPPRGTAARPAPVKVGADLELPVFPNYLQLQTRARISARTWLFLRLGVVAGVLGYIGVLFLSPARGLWLFWQLTVPVLPMLFLVAPGVWRNVCPLAAANQMPRLFKVSRALTPPRWLKEYGFLIGVIMFFGLASSRKWLFNNNGAATGLLILAALVMAWLGGYLFKGKSGWCSSMCPLYPVQRLYNRTPFATVPNAHCAPCVSCTKNCYDFNPGTAYLADMNDNDPHYASYRKFFAAAMPGFIIAYFTLPNPDRLAALPGMYLTMALYIVLSIGVYSVCDALLRLSASKLTALYGATAFNLYYWFGLPGWLKAVGSLGGLTPRHELAWGLQAAILLLSVAWITRTFRREKLFVEQTRASAAVRQAPAAQTVVAAAPATGQGEVTFQPGDVRVPLEAGRTLLEIAEAHNQPLEAGCRMGICGADPIVIQAGMENLPPMGADEKSTLERLGLGGNCRLACMCRAKGPVTVSLETKGASGGSATPAPAEAATSTADYDHSLKSVVVIGNGVAGVTAADYVRRAHPECEIHLIGREKHHLYNRMAITRLIYGRSAMSGLYLQPEAWYDDRRITCWLNTHVTRINRAQKQVVLATGDSLAYDRLILASGSSSFVPPIAGYGLPGTFTLREAEEAMGIRAYIQQQPCSTAVVAGGGLLGLEAAYALHKMGLQVWVLERGTALLRRQLDARASWLLEQQLKDMGLKFVTVAEATAVRGKERVTEVVLKDGLRLPCDVFVAAAGIKPNAELAQEAGLDVKRGIVVDAQMRASVPDIFAAGDVCEYAEQVPGLWPMAVEQAKVAAINATGGDASYDALVPVTLLKVAGIDLTSAGRISAKAEGEFEIVLEDEAERRYRKLVIAEGKIVGAILLGYAREAPSVSAAIKAGVDVSEHLEALRAGQWEVLQDLR